MVVITLKVIMSQMKRKEKRKVTKPNFTNASNKVDLQTKKLKVKYIRKLRSKVKFKG